ncbi:hypothetical protein [Asticcacaulis sp. EMRT-3]|uniref:hypothetical protein n=1 Tax=Asticcacaulis sp. EMRT-3 TaxID=3040349 RepID=UPI0024AF8401|nr:hypothetical protein [Asticcacaulis sp. EMRT-3]MDI7774500.1 hypothetical protein [Asticcacaulis sp. EMRT-3]
MTQPTVIYLGPDAARSRTHSPPPKIFLRTLLFSTSKRGRVIESMHVTLSRNESHQNFSVWVYGEEKLVRGSGLFVGETGIAANHHFLTPKDGSPFKFLPGRCELRVFARLLGERRQKLLLSQVLELSSDSAAALNEPGNGVYFDWGPDSSSYLQHVEHRPPTLAPEDLLDAIALSGLGDRPTSSPREGEEQ